MAPATVRKGIGDAAARSQPLNTKSCKHFRLLDLPAKLRNRIYELALTMGPGHTFDFKRRTRGITQASRQLRDETLGLFFSLTPFRLELKKWMNDYYAFIRKLAALGPAHTKHIRDIAIFIDPDDYPNVGVRHPERNFDRSHDYLIKLWRTFVRELGALGIHAPQLSWPGHREPCRMDILGWRASYHLTQLAVLYEGTIKPLLETAGLLSSTSPDMREKIKARFPPTCAARCNGLVAGELVKVREAFERVDEDLASVGSQGDSSRDVLLAGHVLRRATQG